MRELTVIEIENVSGAGWLKDGLTSFCGKVAEKLVPSSSSLNIELPIIGTVNIADYAPNLSTNVGSAIGSAIGGIIETSLAAIPGYGLVLKKLLGN